MARFEVGKNYGCMMDSDRSNDVTIIKRTAKMVYVRNQFGNEWRMLIKKDENGDEYVRDSLAGRYACAYTWLAKWVDG